MAFPPKKLKTTATTSPPSLVERGLGGEVNDATNWRRWYWLVLGALVAEILFFTYLTRAFSA